MCNVREKYRRVHEQAFVPIFVADRFDALALAEAAQEAGATAIEITCRRPMARVEVRQVKQSFQDLIVLVGSVVDDGPLLDHLRRRDPQFPSIAQLVDAGADGFVSALPLTASTIERYAPTHLMIPGVETLSEAVAAVQHGAHFAKLFTADLAGGASRVARLTCAATHGLVPLFVTGGITLPRVAEYLNAGAAVVGSGWDVICGVDYLSLQEGDDRTKLVRQLRGFIAGAAVARPPRPDVDDHTYVKSLPHYSPFSDVA
jgi:2-dehydro-3-deoxyphosphogluconate aldolase/(4S)-4-hydroxy-2-oxoglutarate aldolase